MKLKLLQIILTLFVFVLSNCWAGKVYKCTTNSGEVYFTDTNCPKGDDYQKKTMKVQSPTLAMKKEFKRQSTRINHEQKVIEAERLQNEAQLLYDEAGSGRIMRRSQRRALQEKAKSLERQADFLLGKRETLSPTRTEQLENKVRELEETIRTTPPPVPNQPQPNFPQYVPSVGKWCQQQSGVMNCW